MDTIEGMRTFAAVATEGSFTAAARRLNMTTKLASKYIRQLEERLNTQLFNRTTRSVTLTDVGRSYLERCRPLLDEFDELEAAVHESQTQLSGPIRITAPTAYGSTKLVVALRPFMAANPAVKIDLHLSDTRMSIVEEGFDLAIRFGALQDSSLIVRKLLDMRLVVCASPYYLAWNGEPNHPQDLAEHTCLINMALTDPGTWTFMVEGTDVSVKVESAFQSNMPRAVAEMAAQGAGIAFCPYYLVEPYVEDGKMVVLFEEYEKARAGLYALYPQNRHLTARVRVLIDHLAESLTA